MASAAASVMSFMPLLLFSRTEPFIRRLFSLKHGLALLREGSAPFEGHGFCSFDECRNCNAPWRRDGAPVLFGLRPRLLDHAGQSLRLGAHAGGELLGRVPDHLEAEPLKPLPNLRCTQRTQVLAVELRDHRGGRAGGSYRAEPPDQLEPGQPRLGDG